MKLSAYRYLFTQTSLDSGTLSILGCVAHRFSEPGGYRCNVFIGEKMDSNFHLIVDTNSSVTQVNVDLAKLNEPSSESDFVISPKGYVLFHVSQGPGGYSLQVDRLNDNVGRVVFDSRVLKEGDLFIATMIRPGTYSITNIDTHATGKIIVAYPEIGKVPYRPGDPVSVQCTDNTIVPDLIRIGFAQAQIFSFKTASRIKIELLVPEDRPKDTGK